MKKLLLCILSLLLTGCMSSDNKLTLEFNDVKTVAVGSLADKVISLSEDNELVNQVIEEYKSYSFKKIDNVEGDIQYVLAWCPTSLQFETSYNIKFKYNEQFFKSAYSELFDNPSIKSIQIIDDYTIIYNNQYYKSNISLNTDVLKDILDLARDYKVSIFVPDEYFENLNEQEMIIRDIDEQSIIKELINVGVLPDFVKINNVKIEGDTVYIDFNQDFTGFIVTMGKAGESMIIKSLVNSYIHTYDVSQVSITVDNQVLQSEYNTYDKPIKYIK